MSNRNSLPVILLTVLFFILLTYFLTFILPWGQVKWGSVSLGNTRTITVTGSSETTERNQVARFNVSVRAENVDKDTAVQEINSKMEDIVKQVKKFGIDEKDIKTRNLDVRQIEKYESDIAETPTVLKRSVLLPPKPKGDLIKVWQASNSIEIILRDVDRGSDFSDLLFATGATDVNGPRLTIDDTEQFEEELLIKAVANARKKAERLADASGARLGKVITLTEGFSSGPQPIYLPAMMEDVHSSTPIEPGTSTLSKTVTVTFELK